ncbi:MAG: 6-bladed beta-propeller [Alphaproteobacteria bacterium]|nr:6-bladed beta-propeller [Alphaproteobacteria bacterium]
MTSAGRVTSLVSRLSARGWKGAVIVTALAIVGLLESCATEPASQLGMLQPAADARVWPGAPETARYIHVTTLEGEQNFEIDRRPSAMAKRVAKWVVGLVVGDVPPRQLQRPVSGFTDRAGRVFVVDASLRAVVVFDLARGEVDIWKDATELEGFGAPIGIAPDGKGGVLVTDAELGSVFHLDRAGDPIGRFGQDDLERPTGIARDPTTGTIYIADTVAHDIKLFDDQGKFLRSIGERGVEEGAFNYPTHLSFADDRLYVSDSLNFRIQVLNASGEAEQSFGETGLYLGNMVRPKGVAVGGDGRVYVAESYHDHLLIYDQDGRFLLPIGGAGKGVGQFYQPSGIWTDRQRRVYVADMYNGRVVVFRELTGLAE